MTNIKTALYEFTTAPIGEVVIIGLVKANANVDFDTDDVLIQMYIDMAVDRISGITGRLLQPAVLNGSYSYPDVSGFQYRPFVSVEKAPITAINQVSIWDGTDYVALATTDWTEEKTSTYSRILFNSTVIYNNSLDVDDLQPYPIQVGFNAGYANSSAIPAGLRGAVMQYATWLYNNRGDCSDCDQSTLKSVGGFLFPNSIADLVCQFIIRRVFG